MRIADCDLRAAVQEKYPVKGLFQRKQGGIAVLGLEFTFPNDNGVPTEAAQLYALFYVALAVALYFIFPEWRVALGHYEIFAFFVSVPEAAVDEYYRAVFAQYNVGGAGQTLYVDSVAVAVGVQIAAHQHLGPGVLAAYARHTVVSLFLCHSICHRAKVLLCI